jgi:hypothetical protein
MNCGALDKQFDNVLLLAAPTGQDRASFASMDLLRCITHHHQDKAPPKAPVTIPKSVNIMRDCGMPGSRWQKGASLSISLT